MVYSLDIYLLCNNSNTIGIIRSQIPNVIDSKLWSNEYTLASGVEDDGTRFLNVVLKFKAESERDLFLTWLKDKAGKYTSDMLLGSFISKHDCNHDEDSITGCTSNIVWSK